MNYLTILAGLRDLTDRELADLIRAINHEQRSRERRGLMVQLNIFEDMDGQQTVFENQLIRARRS